MSTIGTNRRPLLCSVEQPDGMVKMEEPFAAPGEWLAVARSDLIDGRDCR